VGTADRPARDARPPLGEPLPSGPDGFRRQAFQSACAEVSWREALASHRTVFAAQSCLTSSVCLRIGKACPKSLGLFAPLVSPPLSRSSVPFIGQLTDLPASRSGVNSSAYGAGLPADMDVMMVMPLPMAMTMMVVIGECRRRRTQRCHSDHHGDTDLLHSLAPHKDTDRRHSSFRT